MTNIYVGNLSFDATEEDIRQAFAQHGEVASVNVIKDRETGRSRGFAFVEMPDSTQAKEAIEEVNFTDIAGRRVRTLTDRDLAAGDHPLSWDGKTDAGQAAASGLYFIRAVTPFGTESIKSIRLP